MIVMTEPKLRTPILSESVKDLHCKPDAPYPSQAMTTAEMQEKFREDIRKFQRAQEKVTLKEVGK